MNDLFTELQQHGCDVDGTMRRLGDDRELYVDCLHMLVGDESFAQLHEAFAHKNAREIFEAAHTLKGVAGNLGLTPMYDSTCRIVEATRAGQYPADTAEMDAALRCIDGELDWLKEILT